MENLRISAAQDLRVQIAIQDFITKVENNQFNFFFANGLVITQDSTFQERVRRIQELVEDV